MQDDKIYEAWKPLRNFLRKMEVISSLEAIWWYMWSTYPRMASSSSPPLPKLPKDMSYDEAILNYNILFAWELDKLAEEVILNGQMCTLLPQNSLKNSHNFLKALTKLRKLNDTIAGITLQKNNPLDELYRIKHQQFPYQGHSRDFVPFIRYFKLYSNNETRKIVESRLKINCKDLFSAGLTLFGIFLKKSLIRLPIILDGVSQTLNENLNLVARISSVDIDQLRKNISESHSLDDTYTYQLNQLKITPLIKCSKLEQQLLLCPSPFDLQKKFQEGLYYELYDDKKFNDDYNFCETLGNSFQHYIGELLKTTYGANKVYTEDESKQNENKKRCDWIVDFPKSYMFVECKIKRPSQKAYTKISPSGELNTQLEILAEAVIQSYESYNNYANKKYVNPSFEFKPHKQAYIIVVTMEDWYLSGKQKRQFDEIVKQKSKDKGIKPNLLKRVLYITMSSEEFEEFTFFLTRYDGYALLKRYYGECPYNTVHSLKDFIDKDFASKYRYIFEDEFLNCFSDEIKNLLQSTQKL